MSQTVSTWVTVLLALGAACLAAAAIPKFHDFARNLALFSLPFFLAAIVAAITGSGLAPSFQGAGDSSSQATDPMAQPPASPSFTTSTSPPTTTTRSHTDNDSSERASVSFASPADGARVSQVITASGTAVGVQPGSQLWIFVQPQPDGLLFPVAITQAGTAWTASELYVGGDGQAGQSFKLWLVELDVAAQRSLDRYFTQEREMIRPPGLLRADLDAWRVSFLSDVDVVRSS